MNPEDRTILPQVAFTSFRARLRPPTKEEGFQEIFKIDFKVSSEIAIHRAAVKLRCRTYLREGFG